MRAVIDSNVLVSALDPEDAFHGECMPILDRMELRELDAICPVIVLVETICVICRRSRSDALAAAFCRRLTQMPSILWLDISIEPAESAAMLGAKCRLKGSDAIILKVADQYKIPLLTNDKEVKSRAPAGMSVLTPTEL